MTDEKNIIRAKYGAKLEAIAVTLGYDLKYDDCHRAWLTTPDKFRPDIIIRPTSSVMDGRLNFEGYAWKDKPEDCGLVTGSTIKSNLTMSRPFDRLAAEIKRRIIEPLRRDCHLLIERKAQREAERAQHTAATMRFLGDLHLERMRVNRNNNLTYPAGGIEEIKTTGLARSEPTEITLRINSPYALRQILQIAYADHAEEIARDGAKRATAERPAAEYASKSA